MLISQKIELMACRSVDCQRTIGTFLLKEKQHLKKYSMQEIADRTFSSKSTLVRIAKKMGYSGWNEFLSAYLEELQFKATHVSNVDANTPFDENNSMIEIAGKIKAVKQESEDETVRMLDQNDLDRAVEILIKARRICVFGVSVNQFLGYLFQHKMLMIGKPVDVITQAEQRFLAESLTDQDCAILISYSGNDESRNPTSLLRTLNEKKVPVIGITSMGDNLLRSHADLTFTIASREKLYSKIASYATEASIMMILDVLYSGCFAADYNQNYKYKKDLSKAAERRRYSTSEGVLEEQPEEQN